ncbi:MAG: hypothetical protein DWQ44_10710 [Bacteroidetes bacterium]|nr:MAG: hypothetical protein DWQ33_08830 [Bacteroidota bacterium]REK05105.1 MAG: hypothetical protein DWQ39_07840 [Bacteroidota bacterium]REK32511.1 MAG: hypothetical protein DWQ44_10710 [Bacteroidota bacterium]REK49043.1 MAG: hypothetical protein DWQ48_09250 [Bacteroidota bacterium]
MKGKVKILRKYNQRYKNFSFSELMTKADEEYLETIMEMDEKGNLLSESKFDPEGELEEKNSYIYDADGRLLEHVLLFALEDVTEKRVLKRNEKGMLLEETKYYGDDSGERSEYAYNEKDEVVEIKNYDEDGEYVWSEYFSYDSDGSLTEKVKKDREGQIQEHVKFVLTDPKSVIEEHDLKPDGSLNVKTVMEFNEKGKEIVSKQYTADGKLIAAVLTEYDENGNVSEKKYRDFYSKTLRFTYDENNNMTSQELFDGTGLLLRKNVYEYDDNGNMLTEQNFELDAARGGKDKHHGARFEYEYF